MKLFIILLILLTSCMTAPEREQNEIDACYLYRSCMYYNKDNSDKSICAKALDVCLKVSIIEYCKHTIPNDYTFRQCFDLLD